MKVREIMQRSVLTVNKDASIKKCRDMLEKHDINGVPVVDDGCVIGVITRADIFKSILPRYPEITEESKYTIDFDAIERRIQKLNESKVEDLMATPPMVLNPETPIIKAGAIMILRGIKQMPVVENYELVGIITLTDICRTLLARTE